MKFALFVFGVVLIFWLLDLVVELLVEIATKLGRLLQILIVILVILFFLYTEYNYRKDQLNGEQTEAKIEKLINAGSNYSIKIYM